MASAAVVEMSSAAPAVWVSRAKREGRVHGKRRSETASVSSAPRVKSTAETIRNGGGTRAVYVALEREIGDGVCTPGSPVPAAKPDIRLVSADLIGEVHGIGLRVPEQAVGTLDLNAECSGSDRIGP